MRSRTVAVVLFAACAALIGSAGCYSSSATLTFISYADPYFPERTTLTFQDCAYRIDPGGDIHIAARRDTTTDRERLAVREFLHVHLYWKPHPGKTPADPTMADAVIRYVIATPEGTALYTGTGFAFPRTRPGRQLEVALESGRLHLVSTTGTLTDALGETRVSGRLAARRDPGLAARFTHELEVIAAR